MEYSDYLKVYDYAKEQLNTYNLENNTNFKITHNGLEYWIVCSDEDGYCKMRKFLINNFFPDCSIYGYKNFGITLGPPDMTSYLRDEKINKIIDE